MSGEKAIPYFKTPNIDGLEALMSFDREMISRHDCFVRDFNKWDVPDNLLPEFKKQHADLSQVITVVKGISPGTRARRFHECEVVQPEAREIIAFFLPDDFWDDLIPAVLP